MKDKIIGTCVVVALLLGAYGAFRTAPKETVREIVKELGSVASPDIPSPYLKWGDFESWRVSVPFKTSTSTLCVIPTPTASSTLKQLLINITTGTSTNFTLVLDSSTIPYSRNLTTATTSGSYGARRRLTEWDIPGNSTPTLRYYSTTSIPNSDVVTDTVFGPSKYLIVFGDDGGNRFTTTLSSNGMAGFCKAEFDVIGR